MSRRSDGKLRPGAGKGRVKVPLGGLYPIPQGRPRSRAGGVTGPPLRRGASQQPTAQAVLGFGALPRGPEAAEQAQFAVLIRAFCRLEVPHTLSCEQGQRLQRKPSFRQATPCRPSLAISQAAQHPALSTPGWLGVGSIRSHEVGDGAAF